jgi:hypothetical protein
MGFGKSANHNYFVYLTQLLTKYQLTADSLGADWNSSLVSQTVAKSGFETALVVNSTAGSYARIGALNSAGTLIGSTDILEVATGLVTTATGPIQLG